MGKRAIKLVKLGFVSLGARFSLPAAEVGYPNSKQRMVLTVVGLKPRNVNQIVAQDEHGHQSLLRLYMVEDALVEDALRLLDSAPTPSVSDGGAPSNQSGCD